MAGSSGQLSYDTIQVVACEQELEAEDGLISYCDFDGEVDAWVDPEIHEWGWTCPKCGREHVDSTYEGD